MKMWAILFFLLPLLGTVYVSWRMWNILPFVSMVKVGLVALAWLGLAVMIGNFVVGLDRLPLSLARVSYEIGNSWLFVMLYLFMVFLLLDIGRVCHLFPCDYLYSSMKGTVTITMLMFAIFVYGNINYRKKVRVPIDLVTTKPLQRPLKLVLMSDLHLGYHNPRTELARWVDKVNAEHPDLILIGGDIIDISIRPLLEENTAQEFRRLNAPVFACLGNHEYYSGEPKAQRFYADAGIHLLRDSTAMVEGIRIIGRDDRTNPSRKSLSAIAASPLHSTYTILLDHQPYHLEEAEHAGIDFQFSGHTHYGQVWPICWITDAIYECAFGSHQRGNTRYYVSSGIGIWGGKFRIGTRSEYIVATLHN